MRFSFSASQLVSQNKATKIRDRKGEEGEEDEDVEEDIEGCAAFADAEYGSGERRKTK